jgi:DNA adenine methylase
MAIQDPPLRAPFPYYGGKSAIAAEVWKRLGDTPNFVEPFFGSGAVLLSRPADHVGKVETVNDADGFVANFWRAVSADPDAVAHHADWPVNENDLHARHAWLVGRRESLTSRLEGDPDYYNAKIAGWWCWGMCCWIGGGFCSGQGPWSVVDGQLVHLGNAGRGINRQLVHLGNAGRGVNRKRVAITKDSLGTKRQLPHIHRSRGALSYSEGVYEWMAALAERLRYVRVCCGDWSRVCGPTPTVKQGLTAVFLDPPYPDDANRDMGIYSMDSGTVGHAVQEWAIVNGENPMLRIALCGYDSLQMPEGWTMLRWKARGGYGSQGEGRGRENASREVIWFSSHCLRTDGPVQGVLL